MNLIVYTKSYPHGQHEPFLHEEILFLSKKFEKVILVPFHSTNEELRALPGNVQVLYLKSNETKRLNFIFWLLTRILFEKHKWKHIKHFRFVHSYVKNAIKYESSLTDFIAKNNDCINYSFWTEEWAIQLARLKQKGKINSFFTKAHGYDLFESRWEHHFIPLRKHVLNQITKLVFVSEASRNYLTKKFPAYKAKYELVKLGTVDNGMGPIPKGSFQLVSCSNVIPLKRVTDIVKALEQLSFEVHWVHIGTGIEMVSVEESVKLLPPAISVRLMGQMKNKDIIQLYKNNGFDAMILLSESEGGVPVSLQEAASFGIPLIGSDAGGICEIVNDSTGVLLPLNYTIDQVVKAICHISERQLGRNTEFRNGVKAYWKEHHNAISNYERMNKVLQNNV